MGDELTRLATELKQEITTTLRAEIAASAAEAKRTFVGYDDEIAIMGIWGCGPEPGRYLTAKDTATLVSDPIDGRSHRWTIRKRCGGCDHNTCDASCIETGTWNRGKAQPACSS